MEKKRKSEMRREGGTREEMEVMEKAEEDGREKGGGEIEMKKRLMTCR